MKFGKYRVLCYTRLSHYLFWPSCPINTIFWVCKEFNNYFLRYCDNSHDCFSSKDFDFIKVWFWFNFSLPCICTDDKVTVLESEKRAWENSPDAQAIREALNPWRHIEAEETKKSWLKYETFSSNSLGIFWEHKIYSRFENILE